MTHFITIFFSILFLLLPSITACGQQQTPGEPSLDEKIGQMLLIGFRGFSAGAESTIAQDIQKYHLGGVVLFDYDVPRDTSMRNIKSPEQVKQLTKELQSHTNTPLFISIDQEGGQVVRLKPSRGFNPTVSAQHLGELDNTDSTRYYARQTAEILQKLGINTNLAPVVDVNTNPENPVIGGLERSFSSNPKTVTRHAETYIRTLRNHGILTSLKHFPGHGSSLDDSHLGVVDVTETWERKELIPYRKLIDKGLADIVMTAHIYNARLDSSHPATLSKSTITDLLRTNLGFDGVVMSDDLQMGAIRKEYGLRETITLSLQAGVDILVFANNSVFDPEIARKAHTIITELVEEGTISEERINRSYNRIMNLKEKL